MRATLEELNRKKMPRQLSTPTLTAGFGPLVRVPLSLTDEHT